MLDTQRGELEIIRQELVHRRDKQWKIFAWAATLLVAATAGVITLVGDNKFSFPLWPQRAAMSGALIVITGYACYWIHENITFESRARKALLRFLNNTAIPKNMIPDPNANPLFGYSWTLSLLCIASVTTTLFATTC